MEAGSPTSMGSTIGILSAAFGGAGGGGGGGAVTAAEDMAAVMVMVIWVPQYVDSSKTY